MAREHDVEFEEWRARRMAQRGQSLAKAPSSGGRQSSIPGITGPALGHSGVPAVVPGQGSGGANSKYRNDRLAQPSPWIDDVDMGSNWYSPFEPVWPFGPPNITRPREWDFPTGYNLNYIPQRMETMFMLRGMARTWGVLSTIISTRMDQLLRIPWTIQQRNKPRATNAGVDAMRKFFRRPDGKLSYSQWSRKLLFDLFEIDAPAIYFARDRKGRPLSAEVLDGTTIFPLIDDAGRRPDSIVDMTEDGLVYLRRQPAFQQIIKGLPMIDLDESEILYCPMRPRPDLPMFGYPPTEQIIVEASEAIRKTFYQLNFWAEGTIPDLIVTVPDNWTPRQIAMYQAHMDATLTGNTALKSKIRFVPGGMKPFDIKNSSGESLWSQRDETLIRLACYAYSVSPAPFVKMLNRATAQNAQQTAQEEGLYPLMSWWKDDIMDTIIQEKFGLHDVEYVFLPRPEVDLEKQSKIHQIQLNEGMRSRNEVREELGQEPIPDGDVITITTGNMVIPLNMAVSGEALTAGKDGRDPEDADAGNKPAKRGTGGGSARRPAGGKKLQGGIAKPNHASPLPSAPIHKTNIEWNSAEGGFFKVTYSDVQTAASESDGDIDGASHLQLKTGNYKKGHIWIQGLNISIENEKGSLRGEKTRQGIKRKVKMPAPYGYIRGTIGADGMQMDVYIGKHPESDRVWVIDQDIVSKKGKNKGFDEHKVMLGYKSLKRALKDYLKSHYDGMGHERIRAVTEMSVDDLKSWLKDGKMHKPVHKQDVGDVVLTKADTVTTATGLNWYDQTTVSPHKRKKVKRGSRWKQLATAVAIHGLIVALFVGSAGAQQQYPTPNSAVVPGTAILVPKGDGSMSGGLPKMVPPDTTSPLTVQITGPIPTPTGGATAANQTAVQSTIGPATAPTNMVVGGAVFNTSAPVPTNGQSVALQVDAASNLLVNLKTALPAGSSTIGAVTQASGPWTQNVTQFGGNNVVTGTGTGGNGIPRVTVSSDSTVGLVASTNGIGNVGGKTTSVCITPTVTISNSYGVNYVVGGKITFANIFTSTGSGILQDVVVTIKKVETSGFTFVPFNADPSNTAWTDAAVASINAADVTAVREPVSLAAYSGLGTHTVAYATGLGEAFSTGSTSMWGVLIANAALTNQFASTSDVQVCVKVLNDL